MKRAYFRVNCKIIDTDQRYLGGRCRHLCRNISKFWATCKSIYSQKLLIFGNFVDKDQCIDLQKRFNKILELEKKIHISATPEEVYALLSIRNGPIANIKKRPVIHWVQNRKAIATDKKSFLRGTEKFEIDGIAITVAPDFL